MNDQMSKPLRAVCAVAFAALCASCDLLRAGPFAVSSWSPGSGYQSNPATWVVWLEFSADPDRRSVESAFSLKADGTELAGRFVWDGRRVRFTPYEPYRSGVDYRLVLSTEAEGADGLSLDRDFEARFTTRLESGRPAVVSVTPADRTVTDLVGFPIIVQFSEPVEDTSFARAVTISPDVIGVWSSSNGGATRTFTPSEYFKYGTRYEIKLDTDVVDLANNALADTFTTVFDVGSDRTPPIITAVRAVVKVPSEPGSTLTEDLPGTAIVERTAGWETDWGFDIVFDEPVDVAIAARMVVTEPSLPLELVTVTDAPAATVAWRLTGRAARDTSYAIIVRKGVEDRYANATKTEHVFRFTTDGARTAPPSVEEVRFLTNPGVASPGEVYQTLTSANAYSALSMALASYPAGVPKASWADVLIKVALDQSVSPFALMQAFRVETTNSCATFSLQSVVISPTTPAPNPAPPPGYVVARVKINATNTVDQGMVTFVVAKSLIDSRGTAAAADFRLPLLK